MSFSAVGEVYDIDSFRQSLSVTKPPAWAKSVTVHHTAAPSLAQRPRGWKIQHMRNLAHFYGKEKRWSAGPHLFTDEDQVFGLTPLHEKGVHARSFNDSSIGIEMLGNFDVEDPTEDRGAAVLTMTAKVVDALLEWLGLPVTDESILFHRDDPRTSKTCPGTRVDKKLFLQTVKKICLDKEDPEAPKPIDREAIADSIKSIEWQIKKMKNQIA